MRKIAAVIAGLCCPLLLPAQVLYVTSGSGSQSSLYTVNPLNAQSTLIGPVLVGGSGVTVTALAFQPGTGVLFGVTGSEYNPQRQLFTINPLTAATTVIGTIGIASSENASDITFADDGTLFAWVTRGGPLMTLDPTNAARTVIGTDMNGTQGNGLTFTPDGTLYVAGPNEPGNLYTVNRTTGAMTLVAALSGIPAGIGVFNAMASDANGLLYAVGRFNTGHLVTIDRFTGVTTSVGLLSFGSADAMAFSPVPEPSTWALLALGLGWVGLAVRRRLG